MADTLHIHSPFCPQQRRCYEDRVWNQIQRFPQVRDPTFLFCTALLLKLWVCYPGHQSGSSWSRQALQAIQSPCRYVSHQHKWNCANSIMGVDPPIRRDQNPLPVSSPRFPPPIAVGSGINLEQYFTLLLNFVCDGTLTIMYMRSFVGSKPNLNWDKIVTVVAEESDLVCAQSLCTQSEQV